MGSWCITNGFNCKPYYLQTNSNTIYLLSIIEQFSKFGYNYFLPKKKSETILGHLKEFINHYGKPNKLHTDNGLEFKNKIIDKFCQKKNIKWILGRPYHPQSQGCMESYNKEIKRLLGNLYHENPKIFLFMCPYLKLLKYIITIFIVQQGIGLLNYFIVGI